MNKMVKFSSVALVIIFLSPQVGWAQTDLLRQKAFGERKEGTVNKFGPFNPEDELVRRTNKFRSCYIAAQSFGHRSSSGIPMADMLSTLDFTINGFLNYTGMRNKFILEELGEADEAYKQLLIKSQWGNYTDRESKVSAEQKLYPLINSVLLAAGYVRHDFIGSPLADTIEYYISETLYGGPKEDAEENLQKIRRIVTEIRDFCADRAELAKGWSSPATTTSFNDVKKRLIELNKEGLIINDKALTDQTIVSMSPTRLLSLINNLVADCIEHSPEGTKVVLKLETIKETNELKITVSDKGSGIEPKYFEPRENGLIRLFDLEEREGRVPIGLAEVWDIVGIARGTIEVESELGKGTSFIVTLPARIKPAQPVNISPINESLSSI